MNGFYEIESWPIEPKSLDSEPKSLGGIAWLGFCRPNKARDFRFGLHLSRDAGVDLEIVRK
jgi:hypothetical protein